MIEKFKNRADNFKPTDDVSQNDREINEIEEIISNTDQLLDQIKEDFDDDDEELSGQRQLLDKVQEHKNDFDIIIIAHIKKNKNDFLRQKQSILHHLHRPQGMLQNISFLVRNCIVIFCPVCYNRNNRKSKGESL